MLMSARNGTIITAENERCHTTALHSVPNLNLNAQNADAIALMNTAGIVMNRRKRKMKPTRRDYEWVPDVDDDNDYEWSNGYWEVYNHEEELDPMRGVEFPFADNH